MRVVSCIVALVVLTFPTNGQPVQTTTMPMPKADSPISKVVKLITDMKATVEKEASEDQEAYDKYSCWSLTNEKEKKTAIEDAKAHLETQESFLEEAAGTSAQLSTEIEGIKGDLEEAEAALASASEQREKESEEFQASEADMKETIGLLGKAVAKLQAVQLVQKRTRAVPEDMAGEALVQVQKVAKRVSRHPKFTNVMQRDLYDVLGSLQAVARKESHRQGSSLAADALMSEVFLPGGDGSSLVQNFLNAKPNDLRGGSAGVKSHNSQSGAIFGVLGEMKDEFERDLASAQKEDLNALVSFQHLSAAKTGEIKAATEQKDAKESQLADLLAKVAEAKESIESTTAAMDSDTKFLQNLLKNRKSEDEEYTLRVKTRSDEITALGQTLEILTGDAARELFGRTVSFLQTSVSTAAREKLRNQASKQAMQALMRIGRKHNNMALIGMAVRVRLDAFKKVKAAMNKMLGALKIQQAEEYKKWEECKKEIDETEDEIKESTEQGHDLDEKHQELKNTLSELTSSSDELKSEVAESEVQLKKAGEGRKAENILFQSSISDQRATVAILNMALQKLKGVYGFIQNDEAQPETKSFSENALGGGVMQLIQKIITDAEVEATELSTSESHAQAAYAELVKDTTNSIEMAREAIAEKAKASASASSEKSETEEAQVANEAEVKGLQKLLQASHASCDFLLKYFDVRQKARAEEMDAIGEANAILSGANYQ